MINFMVIFMLIVLILIAQAQARTTRMRMPACLAGVAHSGRKDAGPGRAWLEWPERAVSSLAPMTIGEAVGSRRAFDLLNREGRVHAYSWLLQHGDEEQLFTHLDGALLVDAWPEVAPRLPTDPRRQWQPLVLTAGMGWLDGERASAESGRPKPASRQARERAIQRLAERGLTADEIRQVLHRM